MKHSKPTWTLTLKPRLCTCPLDTVEVGYEIYIRCEEKSEVYRESEAIIRKIKEINSPLSGLHRIKERAPHN